ncbi:MAG TPA: hypothetical protein VHX15_01990 [Frankiaceae bacterium]|nr:hypothetical protein [Frankiaceae bacterium]
MSGTSSNPDAGQSRSLTRERKGTAVLARDLLGLLADLGGEIGKSVESGVDADERELTLDPAAGRAER